MANIKNDNPQITIHGSRIIEYRGTIRRITREAQRSIPQNSEAAEGEQ